MTDGTQNRKRQNPFLDVCPHLYTSHSRPVVVFHSVPLDDATFAATACCPISNSTSPSGIHSKKNIDFPNLPFDDTRASFYVTANAICPPMKHFILNSVIPDPDPDPDPDPPTFPSPFQNDNENKTKFPSTLTPPSLFLTHAHQSLT